MMRHRGLARGARFVRCARESGKLRWLHPWRYAIGGALFKVPVALLLLLMLGIAWIGDRLAGLRYTVEYWADCFWAWHVGPNYDREVELRERAWRSRQAKKARAER